MPTLDGYLHADTTHASTIQPAGYRYGCHSAEPRGSPTTITVQSGYCYVVLSDGLPLRTPLYREHTTDWLPMPCGHSTRQHDPACAGCANNQPPT